MMNRPIGPMLLAILFTSIAAGFVATASDPPTDPIDLRSLMTKGKLEADLGNYAAAVEAFSAVATTASATADQRWEARVRLGLARNAGGDYRGGAEAFRQVAEDFSDDPRAIEFLTRAVAGTAPGKVWVGLEPQFEDLLETARIVSTEELIMGVSGPRQVYLTKDEIELRALFKPWILDTENSADRGVYEIAAYELDKMLDLRMVPPAVERVVDGQAGSLQLWVEGCVVLKESEGLTQSLPDIDLERSRMQTFDSLIGNRDRHDGAILVSPAGEIVLIDHTRSFGSSVEIEDPPDRLDRQMVDGLRALERRRLTEKLSGLLSDHEIEALLERRDALMVHVDHLLAEKGEAGALF